MVGSANIPQFSQYHFGFGWPLSTRKFKMANDFFIEWPNCPALRHTCSFDKTFSVPVQQTCVSSLKAKLINSQLIFTVGHIWTGVCACATVQVKRSLCRLDDSRWMKAQSSCWSQKRNPSSTKLTRNAAVPRGGVGVTAGVWPGRDSTHTHTHTHTHTYVHTHKGLWNSQRWLTGEPDGAAAESAPLSEHLSSLRPRHMMCLHRYVGRNVRHVLKKTKGEPSTSCQKCQAKQHVGRFNTEPR